MMKIRHLHLPSGTTEGIPVLIDANRSLEQAVAVYEVLDDLRAQIWQHYGTKIQQHYLGARVIERVNRDTDGPEADNRSDRLDCAIAVEKLRASEARTRRIYTAANIWIGHPFCWPRRPHRNFENKQFKKNWWPRLPKIVPRMVILSLAAHTRSAQNEAQTF